MELFDRYEPVSPPAKGQFVYRFLSGYAHGKQWALIQGAKRATPADVHGHSLALVASDDTATVAATHRAVHACDRAVNAYVGLRQ